MALARAGMIDFKPFLTLLAVVNPLAALPFFITYTQGYNDHDRKKTIYIASFTSFVVIASSALFGLKILDFFGVTLPSFQVGGGLLLLMSSLSMLNAQPAEARSNSAEIADAAARASVAVVPLTIPLLTGPATMSTVVIFAEKAKTLAALGNLIAAGAAIGLITAACFFAARPIAHALGKTGINVMTRLMGLILAALAVEVMADGLVKIFPALAN